MGLSSQNLLTSEERKKEIVEYAAKNLLLVSERALALLSERDDWKEIIEKIRAEGKETISGKDVEELTIKTKLSVIEPEVEVGESRFRPEAKEVEADYRIIRDITGRSNSEGKVEEFLEFFKMKFEVLKKIIVGRHMLSIKPIKALKRTPERSEIVVVGMVNRKWKTKSGHTAIELEDPESKCIAIMLKDNRELVRDTTILMVDDVIGVQGTKVSDEMIIVSRIFWPDVPQRGQKHAKRELNLLTISDLHVGSKLFLEKSFQRFLDWVNGRVGKPSELREIGKVKYLFISGDNVDGVGIYPNQYDELNIKDVEEQYRAFSRLIMEIPEYIEIFIIPGQHDAVRWADPQPAIPEELVPELAACDNVHLLGSPSWVEVEGLKVVMYHGACMHDLIANTSGLSYEQPHRAAMLLLKKRHLMPGYGLKQPYMPEHGPYMLFDEVPDIVIMGDLHNNSYGYYRGTTFINNGTWQKQTPYQIKLGHVPTPGTATLMELKTGKITETKFQQVE